MAVFRLSLSVLALVALACGGIADLNLDEPKPVGAATGGRPGGDSGGGSGATDGTGGTDILLPVPAPVEPEPECQHFTEYRRDCSEPAEWRRTETHCFTLEELTERCQLARLIDDDGGMGGYAGESQNEAGGLGGAAGSGGPSCPGNDRLEWGQPPRHFYRGICGSEPVEQEGRCCYQVDHTWLLR